jgi:hypothetical protein
MLKMVFIVSLWDSKSDEMNKRITKWSCPFHILQSKSGGCTFSISRQARPIQIQRATTIFKTMNKREVIIIQRKKCWQHENFLYSSGNNRLHQERARQVFCQLMLFIMLRVKRRCSIDSRARDGERDSSIHNISS